MMNFKIASTLLAGVALMACAADPNVGDVQAEGNEGLEAQAMIVSVNAAGTWTADAQVPYISGDGPVSASANFTGPAGYTRKMGACLLKKTATACNTVADCASAPLTLPAGGYRYCTAENGAATKSCYFRPGPSTTYCAGSPANGGVPIAPGTVTTGLVTGLGKSATIISYACFEGCLFSDPSSSSPTQNYVDPGIIWCGSVRC